jgi:hypothetical protein
MDSYSLPLNPSSFGTLNPLHLIQLEDGIFCEGEENFCRIEKNHHICNNKKAGIRAADYSTIKILNNIISNKQFWD